jgi:hypothetical protein
MQTLKAWMDLPEISRSRSENGLARLSRIVVRDVVPVLKIALSCLKRPDNVSEIKLAANGSGAKVYRRARFTIIQQGHC